MLYPYYNSVSSTHTRNTCVVVMMVVDSVLTLCHTPDLGHIWDIPDVTSRSDTRSGICIPDTLVIQRLHRVYTLYHGVTLLLDDTAHPTDVCCIHTITV